MVVVIGLIVIATILTVTVSISLLDSSNRSAARGERVGLQATLDAGSRAYSRALAIGDVSERTRYAMTQATATSVIPPGSIVLRDTDASVATKYRLGPGDGVHERIGTPVTSVLVHDFAASADPTVNERFVVRSPIDATTSSFWQVVRVEIPTSIVSGSRLAVYIRAWRGSNDGVHASRERVVRLELSAGYFSDYQMLVNSSVVFGGGALINGPIHSNGTSETPGVSAGSHTVARGSGGVSCGGGASVTTGVGTIDLPPSCNPSSATGTFIDFGRVGSSFDRIESQCAVTTADAINCYPPVSGRYTVGLYPTFVRIIRPSGVTTDLPTSTGAVVVLMFQDDISISGSGSGRVTIAARHPAGTSNRAAEINITGDVTMPMTVPRRDVLGLMAEGHIIIDLPTPVFFQPSTCWGTRDVFNPPTSPTDMKSRPGSVVRTIQAALIAATGGVRMPVEWTTYARPVLTPYCDRVHINGAIASHYAPVLEWSWTNFYKAGFEHREYTWDPTLRENPPPYFPLTRTWQAETTKDANLDCLRGGSRPLDWTCR